VRTDYLDYPTAWAIQDEVGPSLDHGARCSSVPGWCSISGPAFLCDCGAVEKEWQRRVAQQPTGQGMQAPAGGESPPQRAQEAG
jgi:hypothetical protein